MLVANKFNKVKALHDYWTFIDLIGFKGGTNNFGQIHHELAEFVAEPDKVSKSLKVTGEWVEHEEMITRSLILMPRGHLKSTVASVGYVLWRIYRNPNIRIVVGTNVKELAWSFIRELRSYLEDDELQRRVWNNRPHVNGPLVPELDRSGRRRTGDNTESIDKKVIWSATAIQVIRSKKMKEPTVQATSVGSRLTGGHYDLLILDDIVDFRNTASPELLQKTFEWTQDLESVLDPRRVERVHEVATVPFFDVVGDQIVVLGTRYAKDDFYEYLLNNQDELGYKVMIRNIYVNGIDDHEGFLWPERFNKNVIEKLRKRLTSRRFASQYLNTIIVSGEQVFDVDNLQYYPSTAVDIRAGEVTIMYGERPFPKVRPYLVVDPAISDNKKADDTSITVGGFDQNGEFWILEQRTGKFRPLDTAAIIKELVNKWKLAQLWIEQVGGFKAVAYTVKEYLRNNKVIAAIYEWKPTGQQKKTRIENYLEPHFTSRTIHVPQELKTDEIVQNSLMYFPSDVVKDDVPDTWAMLVEVAKPPLSEEQKQAQRRTPPRAFRNVRYGGTR